VIEIPRIGLIGYGEVGKIFAAGLKAQIRETFQGIDWPKQGAYFFSRVAQHGPRHCRQAAVGGRSGQGRCVQGRGPGRRVTGLCGRADRGPSRGG